MVSKTDWGRLSTGAQAHLYTLQNETGSKAVISDYGAVLKELWVPNIRKEYADVVLGFDTVAEYEDNPCFFGATIGRVANRTEGAEFELNGRTYTLPVNENANNLHSSRDAGFHKVMWTADYEENGNSVKLSYHSPHLENGFPGNLDISVTYTLTNDNELIIDYDAVCDEDSVLAPTNHTYFNLKGQGCGDILDTILTISADSICEVGEGSIPTGRLINVAGTPFDFTAGRVIGKSIDDDNDQLNITGGYDHNFALINLAVAGGVAVKAADKEAGRSLEMYTRLPGVQFYAGNYITRQNGKQGAVYDRRSGFCLESQYFPNSLRESAFEKPVIKKDEPWHSRTSYYFGFC